MPVHLSAAGNQIMGARRPLRTDRHQVAVHLERGLGQSLIDLTGTKQNSAMRRAGIRSVRTRAPRGVVQLACFIQVQAAPNAQVPSSDLIHDLPERNDENQYQRPGVGCNCVCQAGIGAQARRARAAGRADGNAGSRDAWCR